MEIKDATSGEDIAKCWEAMRALRPHLVQDQFVPMVMEMMTEGYRLSYIEADGIAAAVIGYRFQQFLFNGKHCYIDDLSTLPQETGKGYASRLIDYVQELSRQRGLQMVTLDSGFTRNLAHRLYLQKRFEITAFHFSKKI